MWKITLLSFVINILLFAESSSTAPRLVPGATNEYIFDEGESLIFSCNSNTTTVTFDYPKTNKLYGIYTSPIHYEMHIQTSRNLTTSTIQRRNLVYGDTGYYRCYNVNKTKSEKLKEIYVYVKSISAAFIENTDTKYINGYLGEQIVIPCRTTRPDLNVTFFYYRDDTEVENETNRTVYDPKVGFIHHPLKKENGGHVVCATKLKSIQKMATYYMTVLEPPKPKIVSSEDLLIGTDFRIDCVVTYLIGKQPQIQWNVPNALKKNLLYSEILKTNNISEARMIKRITIQNLSYDDEGSYTCKSFYNGSWLHEEYQLKLYSGESNEHLRLSAPSEYILHKRSIKEHVQFLVLVTSTKPWTFHWTDSENNAITGDWITYEFDKYAIKVQRTELILRINDLTIFDSGYYTATIRSGGLTKSVVFSLQVHGPPTLTIQYLDTFYTEGNKLNIGYTVYSNPMARTSCSFRSKLSSGSSPLADANTGFEKTVCRLVNYESVKCNKVTITFPIPRENGVLSCQSCVKQCLQASVKINITGLTHLDDPKRLKGNMFCQQNSDDLDLAQHANMFVKMVDSETKKSHEYYCNITKNEVVSFHFVTRTESPKFQNYVRTYASYTTDEPMKLDCPSQTLNETITWYKAPDEGENDLSESHDMDIRPFDYKGTQRNNDDLAENSIMPHTEDELNSLFDYDMNLLSRLDRQPIEISPNDVRFAIMGNDRVLLIVQPVQNLEVSCRRPSLAVCTQTTTTTSTTTTTTTSTTSTTSATTTTTMKPSAVKVLDNAVSTTTWMIVASLIVGAVVFVTAWIIKAILKRRKEEKSWNRSGSSGSGPFPDWEIPKRKVALGLYRGSGKNGANYRKAKIEGLFRKNNKTEVYVKIIKNRNTSKWKHPTAREINTRIKCGLHINIAAFIGCYHGKWSQGQLWIISEACHFGRLDHYIRSHQDRITNRIEPNIPGLTYMHTKHESLTSFVKEKRVNQIRRIQTRREFLLLSDSTEISEEDLIFWTYQIACGMEFLSSQNIIHGNLRLKYVYLTHNNIVKLSNFGSVKPIYKKSILRHSEEFPEKHKWMAIEQFRDKIFSVDTDIWSFGIVMWEIMSVGEIPYPDISIDILYGKLIEGYRMEKPDRCPTEMYAMMKSCWKSEKTHRPRFSCLVRNIGMHLEEHITQWHEKSSKIYIDKMNILTARRRNIPVEDFEIPEHSPAVYIGETSLDVPSDAPVEFYRVSTVEHPSELPGEVPNESVELYQLSPVEIRSELPRSVPEEIPRESHTELRSESPLEICCESPVEICCESPVEICCESPTELPRPLPVRIPQSPVISRRTAITSLHSLSSPELHGNRPALQRDELLNMRMRQKLHHGFRFRAPPTYFLPTTAESNDSIEIPVVVDIHETPAQYRSRAYSDFHVLPPRYRNRAYSDAPNTKPENSTK